MLQSLPKDAREMVGNVIFMLVPSANTFGECPMLSCFVSCRQMVLSPYANPDLLEPNTSVHRVNPLSHLVHDSYFKPELEAILHLFLPLPDRSAIPELKTLVRRRVNYVMKRQTVSHTLHLSFRMPIDALAACCPCPCLGHESM